MDIQLSPLPTRSEVDAAAEQIVPQLRDGADGNINEFATNELMSAAANVIAYLLSRLRATERAAIYRSRLRGHDDKKGVAVRYAIGESFGYAGKDMDDQTFMRALEMVRAHVDAVDEPRVADQGSSSRNQAGLEGGGDA